MFESQISADLMSLILDLATNLLAHDHDRYNGVFRGTITLVLSDNWQSVFIYFFIFDSAFCIQMLASLITCSLFSKNI